MTVALAMNVVRKVEQAGRLFRQEARWERWTGWTGPGFEQTVVQKLRSCHGAGQPTFSP